MMTLVPIALYGWLAVSLAVFALFPARRAALIVLIGGWLFLPMASIPFSGLPNLSKTTAIGYGLLLGVGLFDSGRLLNFRPRLIDIPMAMWCVTPFLSSLSNNLGLHDAFSSMFEQTIVWGTPFLIGRLYFTTLAAHRELAIGVLIGGLVYVPLCLYEARMSPQLHTMVYGYHQHSFLQAYRFGGWRPTVFMQHGLMVAAWMMTAAILAFGLWRSRAAKLALWTPMPWLFGILLFVTVLCRSLGAMVLLLVGLGVTYAAFRLRRPVIILVLGLAPMGYMGARVVGWDPGRLASIAERVSVQRAQSLVFRFENETLLMNRAMQRPILGWGGWGRNRIIDEYEGGEAVTDGLWIIYFGTYGVIGLLSLYGWLLIPPILASWRILKMRVSLQEGGATLTLSIVAILFAIDTIPNAMVNPVFFMLAGALASIASAPRLVRTKRTTPGGRPGPGGQGGTSVAERAFGRLPEAKQ